jgi:hypothetical protein
LADHEIRLFKEELTEANVAQVVDFEVVSVFIYSNLNSSGAF